jgi:hypothetical protein
MRKGGLVPGLPDGLFSNQIPSFGTFEWKILIAFTTIWYNLWPFALFYGNLVFVVAIRYIIPKLVYCQGDQIGRFFAN